MRRFLFAAAVAWGFWAAVSLWNFEFLGGLAVPALLLVLPDFYLKYWNFVEWPVLVSLFCACMAGGLVHLMAPSVPLGSKVLVVNIVLLCVLVLSADFRKNHLMDAAVRAANAECFGSRSVISSVGIAGEEFQFDVHAVYRKGSEVFVWSYRDLSFFKIPETISRNLNLMGCEKNASDEQGLPF
ncbi:hypothetical protein [Aminobacter aminovorans]|uniref:hypothetical protein n=1 Tax=Aminobacter aminovorans TaxID=83263 RepID=UPI00285F9DBA|nr:hypothetical protein [Aminobacter aminovorans]MDR7220095.1 hypothetical protein [Aminobacter aminovorans]